MAACSNCCCRFLLLEGKDEGFTKKPHLAMLQPFEINTHIKPREKEEEEVCTHILGIIVAAGDVIAAHDASLMLPTLFLPFQEVDLLEQLLLMELELPHALLFVYSCFFSSSPFSCPSPLSEIYSPPLMSRSTTLLILPTPLVDAELGTLPVQRTLLKSRTLTLTLTLIRTLKSWTPFHGLALRTILWLLQMKSCSTCERQWGSSRRNCWIDQPLNNANRWRNFEQGNEPYWTLSYWELSEYVGGLLYCIPLRRSWDPYIVDGTLSKEGDRSKGL